MGRVVVESWGHGVIKISCTMGKETTFYSYYGGVKLGPRNRGAKYSEVAISLVTGND